MASARGCAHGHPLSGSTGIPPVTRGITSWPHGRERAHRRASQWSAQPAATSSHALSKRGAPGSTTAVTGPRRHGTNTSASPAARTLPLAVSTRTSEGRIAPHTALGGHMLRLAPVSTTQRPAATIPPSERDLAARLGGRAPPSTSRARRTTVAAGASGCRSPRAAALAFKGRPPPTFLASRLHSPRAPAPVCPIAPRAMPAAPSSTPSKCSGSRPACLRLARVRGMPWARWGTTAVCVRAVRSCGTSGLPAPPPQPLPSFPSQLPRLPPAGPPQLANRLLLRQGLAASRSPLRRFRPPSLPMRQ